MAPLSAPDNVTVLESAGKTYYLLGTAHVSKESVREVADLIERVRPDAVCVELCPTRYEALVDRTRRRVVFTPLGSQPGRNNISSSL